MTIETDGNVGIGTTNPQSKLHVSGDLKVTGGISFRDTDTTYNGTNKNSSIYSDNNADRLQYNGSAGHIFTVGGSASGGETTAMKIDSDGNVGIGTDNPQATLDVNGTAKLSRIELSR